MTILKVNLEIIKTKRESEGYTTSEMADKLKLANGSLYWKREAGQYKFKPEEVMMVSEILGIPFKSLFLSESYSKKEINKEVV